MRFLIIGTSGFTLASAEGLLDAGQALVGIVSLPHAKLPNNSADLAGWAAAHKIPYYESDDLNQQAGLSLLRSLSPDFIFSSWPHLLGPDVLSLPKYGVIGSHPTSLPKNRGRHPLHWLIANRISKSHLSFFRMDEGVDSGNLLLQLPYTVTETTRINDLVSTVAKLGREGSCKLATELSSNPGQPGRAQDHTAASKWRKRTPFDVVIDPRMTAADINALVRSFSLPYPCAKLIFREHVIQVLDCFPCEPLPVGSRFSESEPGRILFIDIDRIQLRAADAAIGLVLETNAGSLLKSGSCIHPPLKYFSEHGEKLLQLLSEKIVPKTT